MSRTTLEHSLKTVPATPSCRTRRRSKSGLRFPRSVVDQIRWGIWIYILLWLLEGALRRWFLPGLEKPLLIVRDPVAIGIYFLALRSGYWPRNGFMTAMFLIAPLSFLFGIAGGHGSPFVAAYGVRCDFLHVPLIFIIAKVLTHRDLRRLCRCALWISIPYTLLLVLQFYSSQSAWVNRGLGGDLSGAGFSGALDKFRPPGTFSFITGPAQLYPMFLSAWFYLLIRRKLSTLLMAASLVAIFMAIPFSISRALLIGELIVAAGGLVGCFIAGILSSRMLGQITLGAIAASAAVLYASNSTDAFDAFAVRWENSTTKRGGIQATLGARIWHDLTAPFVNVPMMGFGTGISTQVGQRLATGNRGFGHSEGEWGRILAEGGALVGPLILLFRLSLIGAICLRSYAGVIGGRAWVLALAGAAVPGAMMGQWGQTTSLGSAVIAVGLCLASARRVVKPPNSNRSADRSEFTSVLSKETRERLTATTV